MRNIMGGHSRTMALVLAGYLPTYFVGWMLQDLGVHFLLAAVIGGICGVLTGTFLIIRYPRKDWYS